MFVCWIVVMCIYNIYIYIYVCDYRCEHTHPVMMES